MSTQTTALLIIGGVIVFAAAVGYILAAFASDQNRGKKK